MGKLAVFHIFRQELVFVASQTAEAVCDRLAAGENAVLVSDAGLPAISDPGEDPVRLCHERHIPVAIVPGPCAAAMGAVPFTLITGIACVIYNLDNRQMSNTYVKAFRKLLNCTPFVRQCDIMSNKWGDFNAKGSTEQTIHAGI